MYISNATKKAVASIVFVSFGFVAIYCLIFALSVSGVLMAFIPNPPRPKIKHGEFPFRIEYEICGELHVYEDTLVCEFDGFVSRGTAGKYRKWKSSLKSGNENALLLDLRSLNETNWMGQTVLELYFYVGNSEYYMGDDVFGNARAGQSLDIVEYVYTSVKAGIGYSGYSAEEAFEKYGIKLIGWYPSDPIVNSFSY